jgi:hypothetical protein
MRRALERRGRARTEVRGEQQLLERRLAEEAARHRAGEFVRVEVELLQRVGGRARHRARELVVPCLDEDHKVMFLQAAPLYMDHLE